MGKKDLMAQLTATAVAVVAIMYAGIIQATIDAGEQTLPYLSAFVPQILENNFAVGLFLNGGFSIGIAVIISVLVDKDVSLMSKRLFSKFENEVERVSKEAGSKSLNIYLRTQYPSEYIDLVMDMCFSGSLFRDYLYIDYTIDDAGLGGDKVKLTTSFDSEIKNVSSIAKKFPVVFYLPKSTDPDLLNLLEFESVFVEGLDVDLDKIMKDIDHQKKDLSAQFIKVDAGSVEIPGNESRKFLTRYSIGKYSSDNEVYRVLLPTKDLRVSVNNHSEFSLLIKCARFGDGEMEQPLPPASEKSQTWKNSSFSLPHHGYVLYWGHV